MDQTLYIYAPDSGHELVCHKETMHTYPWHVHAEHTVTVHVTQGSLTVALPDKRATVSAGHSLTISCGTAHALFVEKGTLFETACLPETSPAHQTCAVLKEKYFLLQSPAMQRPLAAMARDAGMSQWHFLRCFKRKTGLPPHAFLQTSRLRFGRRLLRQGQSIAEAALLAGFTDQSHFTRLFKKHHGMTPRAFQQRSISTEAAQIWPAREGLPSRPAPHEQSGKG